jgi:hypothetical protein
MQTSEQSVRSATDILHQISDAIFNTRSLVILVIALIAGIILGRLVNIVIGNISNSVGRQADKAGDRATVKRLRRVETLLVLSTALVRVLFVGVALYSWWMLTHPAGKPTALIGASAAIALLLNGVFSPVLRDIAFGSGMMAEQWFGVGDLVTIVPFDMLGVVERITLRSTKVRTLDGDSLWITNQNIAGAKIVKQGVRTIAIEIFVPDDHKAEAMIEHVNNLLPDGPSLLVSPISIMSKQQRTKGCWRVIAIGETAPGREYLLEKNAIDIMKKYDEKHGNVLLAEPISRYADTNVERQFGRAINNAKKKDIHTPNLVQISDSIKHLRHLAANDDKEKQS